MGEYYLPAQHLAKGSNVIAHDGETVLTVVDLEQHESDKVIELRAGDASLSVTPDHRVFALPGASGIPCDVKAKELKQGDRIFVNSMPVQLISAEEVTLPQKQAVFKITLNPDMPVA